MSDAPRRVGRPGSTPPPRAASPAIAVVVTLIAAVLGFFILRSLDDDNDSGASPDTEEVTTTLGLCAVLVTGSFGVRVTTAAISSSSLRSSSRSDHGITAFLVRSVEAAPLELMPLTSVGPV